MTAQYRRVRRRGPVAQAFVFVEDFMNWFLYGTETWLVAVLKGVPLFLYAYFLLAYVPNYAYYFVTDPRYFLQFSEDVGFLVAQGVGFANFIVLIIITVWTQAARGRIGFWWSLIRYLDFLQFLGIVLVLVPFMAFNLGGGSLIPLNFPITGLALGTMTAAAGVVGLGYLYLEYKRITRREARRAAAASASYQAG